MFEGFRAETVQTGEVEIACLTRGDGPPVLLLHGFPQTKAMWARVAPSLAERHRVIVADLRGYGDSGKPHGPDDAEAYAFRAMAADQVALMAALGHERFHLIGHDRGGRTAHRLALDHPERVASLAVLDIIPTLDVLDRMDRALAMAYWHWQFLALPEPYPERLIGADPDYFFTEILARLGGLSERDVDPEALAEYRRCWRDPATVHGVCADYRSAVTVDAEHDRASLDGRVGCPTLALWGADSVMGRMFDVEATWRARCEDVRGATVPGGHFFIDQHPAATTKALEDWLARVAA